MTTTLRNTSLIKVHLCAGGMAKPEKQQKNIIIEIIKILNLNLLKNMINYYAVETDCCINNPYL